MSVGEAKILPSGFCSIKNIVALHWISRCFTQPWIPWIYFLFCTNLSQISFHNSNDVLARNSFEHQQHSQIFTNFANSWNCWKVANNGGSRFKSQTLKIRTTLLLIWLLKKTNTKKKRPGMAYFQKRYLDSLFLGPEIKEVFQRTSNDKKLSWK